MFRLVTKWFTIKVSVLDLLLPKLAWIQSDEAHLRYWALHFCWSWVPAVWPFSYWCSWAPKNYTHHHPLFSSVNYRELEARNGILPLREGIQRQWVFVIVCTLFLIICEFESWKWRFRWRRAAGCGSEWRATARSWRRRRLLCMTAKLGFGEPMLKEGSFFFFFYFWNS